MSATPAPKPIMWIAMTIAAIGIAGYALAAAIAPVLRSPFVDNMIQTTPNGAILHFLAGTVVIVIGALQFNANIRSQRPHLHRWLGRIYLGGVLIGGVAGLYLSFYSFGGVVAHYGFGMLAVCWLGTTWMAFTHIRARRVQMHKEWMIRSYALCLAAVTLRIYIPLFLITGSEFDDIYPAVAWLCWVPNILIAEWLIIPRMRPGRSQGIDTKK